MCDRVDLAWHKSVYRQYGMKLPVDTEEVLQAALVEGNVNEVVRIITDAGDEFPVNGILLGKLPKSFGQFTEPTALTIAAKYGHTLCVRRILELGGDLYSVGRSEEDEDDLYEAGIFLSEDYFSALFFASSRSHVEVVQDLIEFRLFEVPGIKSDYVEYLEAAKSNDFSRIHTLLELVEEKNVYLKGWRGHNIMNLCLLMGCPSVCLQRMIDHGIGANGWDYNGLTPLMCAILGRNVDCVQLLLDRGADPYEIHILRRMSFQDDGTVLYIDDTGREVDFVELGTQDKWSAFYHDYVGPSAVAYAAAMGNIPILRLMLEAAPKDIPSLGRFERFQGAGPLHFAVNYATVEAVSFILEFNAAIEFENEDILSCAINNDNTEIFELLFDRLIQREGWSCELALVDCVLSRNSRVFSIVLSKVKEDVFGIGGGHTFFLAIAENFTEFVELFMKRPEFSVDGNRCSGTQGFLPPAHGLTGFMFSCRHGHVGLAKMFFEMGADVNAVGLKGKTAAMFAAQLDQVKCLEFLFDVHADFDAVDNDGGTVFSAALLGDGISLEFLLNKGVFYSKGVLKGIHRESVKVYGMPVDFEDSNRDHYGILPVKNVLLLIKHKVFHWEWCHMVDTTSLHSILFATVTSGISPGKWTNDKQNISPFVYATLINDAPSVRYLLANQYFLPEDYRILTTDASAKGLGNADDSEDMTFLKEQLTLQPLSLQTWNVMTISESVMSSSSDSVSVPDSRNDRVDALPLPVALKNVLKSESKFSHLCPRHWKRLGPQKGENCDRRFDDLVVNGDVVCNPTLEKCVQLVCPCGGLGLTLEEIDNEDDIERKETEEDDYDLYDYYDVDEDYVDEEDLLELE